MEGRLYAFAVEVSYLNSFKPGSPFYGTFANRIVPDVTPQNAASHLGLFCLLRGFSSKIYLKIENHS